MRKAGWERAKENCQGFPPSVGPPEDFWEQGAYPTFCQPSTPRPDSRVTGLGDEGAQLLDPVINVESPATLNFGGRGEKKRVVRSSIGQREKRTNWGAGRLLQEEVPKEGQGTQIHRAAGHTEKGTCSHSLRL